MLPSESPFPCQWWGTGLENVGLGEVRPNLGTYGCYELNGLPPLPFDLKGDFGWLVAAKEHDEHSISEAQEKENLGALASLREAAAQQGVRLPEAFTRFMASPELQRRVRSNTDCFLDLCPEPVLSTIGAGRLVRFLADSQGCVFWYLYLTPDGTDHAVVSSTEFHGTADEQDNQVPDPAAMVYSAESFEAFICRYWLENEIWFAEWEDTPMPVVGQKYIALYKNQGQKPDSAI